MDYEVGQIVQFGYLHANVLHVMLGKIRGSLGSHDLSSENSTKSKKEVKARGQEFELYIAEQSKFPHANEDGTEVETVRVPLRMMGRVVHPDEPSEKLLYNWKTESRVGWLAKIENLSGDQAIGRIIGVSFDHRSHFKYYVILSKRNEDFKAYDVDASSPRGGVFAELYPTKQVVGVSATQILDSKPITDQQRADNKLCMATYLSALKSRLTKLGLDRKVIKVVHTIPDKTEEYWYAFTTDDHYLDCSNQLRAISTNISKDFLTFIPDSQVPLALRPEARAVVLTRKLDDPKGRANPPVAWLAADEMPGFDVFHTYVTTEGKHKIFANRDNNQIITMCEELLEDGSRLPTKWSLLLQGYFHKNFHDEVVDEFKAKFLWFFY